MCYICHCACPCIVHSVSDVSVIAPIHTSPDPSAHSSDDKHQEIPDKFPSTNYGEKNPSVITAKIPNGITLTLHQAKFQDEAPGTSNGAKYLANFPLSHKWVKFMEIYLRNYVLDVF